MIDTNTDIDIDVANRSKVLDLFPNTPAANSKAKNGKHNTGVYFHKVPSDPMSGICTLDYKEAAQEGYFKLDILNVSILNQIRDNAHHQSLLSTEPIWELLEYKDFCDLLFHLKGHHEVCQKMKPTNIIELAAVLAMIRPAKRYLVGRNWDRVMEEIWLPPKDNAYYFKKSHAVGYAHMVVVHMNLLTEQSQE